ncbi:sensory box/GGDEF family protein [Vibrio orientalis CIP 102891 = ATCC 33934]|uniref:Sensory box/GGDEF family protein n=1 Tax=Vibrio orientalis CIP 102891 = ATCC 33934 TaxID=675816 RepID=C9QC16_VIBOR|nr:sensory box/GGDEF family protein [Vibrio orientalis CIP 102891 = ATCC 33934]EGU49045.1 sensory box/GGDEF family protein [Vibrio orientalis CIP 102891 = ATCC 33934]
MELKATGISTRVLYLDTKRLQSDEYLQQLYHLYKTKFEQEKFRAIVVSDNNALALMNKLSSELGQTPVIFGGINNYTPELHQDISATGVIEDIDLLSNISLIERLQGEVDSIYIISDHSVTGEAVRAQMDAFLTNNPKYREIVTSVVPDSYNQLLEIVTRLDTKSSILFGVYYRDKDGTVRTDVNQWKKLNETSNAPIYMVHDLGLGYGAVGGVIQSGKTHGKQAANILVEVLENPDGPLPNIEVGTPEIKLDYQAVLKWGLGIEGEAASVIFNKPLSFSQRYKNELKIVGSMVSVLSVIILVLIYYLSRIKRSEQLAKESQTLIEMVFDQSYHFIGVLDEQGTVVSSNRKLQELLYDHNFSVERPIWQHHHWEVDTAQQIEQFFTDGAHDIITQFEAEIWHAELGSMVLELSFKPIPSLNSGKQFLLEARDITSRKITEERLFQREANLSHYYDQQPIMMLTLDDQNRIQQVNQFAEQLLGYTSDQLLGHRLRDFYLHDDAIIPRQVLLQPKQALKGVWRREIEYRHCDGHTVWIRENIRPLVETGHLLIVGEDVTATRQLSDQLQYQAEHDLLTGTYSRNYFETELVKALAEVESYTRTHAMLYIDLDQLKVLNDTAGHEAGDAAIQFCASMLEEVLPYNTILARLGGDEFAILLRDCTEVDAKKLASTIINTLSEHPFIWEDIRLNLNCSIGIRLIDHTALSPQMVHAQADTACHVAKEEGRNRYNLYCLDDKELRRREQEMESVNLVHDALANQRIELFAQQILSLTDSESGMHFEILIRIKNAQGEYISPGIFMPASERYNIAHLLDKQVVTQTLDWLAENDKALEQLSLCSINLSGHSMGNKEFIAFLLNKLETSTVPCEKICLEITETAAMSNMNQAIEFFTQLKELGCRIALDDFGSGLSSFGYLKKLPVDIVKIDGLFVRDIDVNEMDHLMVRSINDLARQMGKKTVAEFVENTRIIEQLMELQVDYAQGYIIGKPKPLAELVEELMHQQKS